MVIRLILFIFFALSFTVQAKLYSQGEIKQLINGQKQQMAAEFVRSFFTAKKPIDFINEFINSSNSSALLREYQLSILLEEVARIPKQVFLLEFIDLMQHYEIQALQRHDEGAMQVPVFNLNSRAGGIINIWQAQASLDQYSRAFNHNPIDVLKNLQGELSNLTAPQWLGLKQSINHISAENHILINDYLISDVGHLTGLDKFVSHYALLTANNKLVETSLLHMNKSSSEFLLRKLGDYFDAEFVANQLISSVENKRHEKFAITMMASYVDTNTDIQDTLFSVLGNQKLSSASAFVLAQTHDLSVLNRLAKTYAASHLPLAKRHIIYALSMNKMAESKAILQQTISPSSDEKTDKWLEQLQGESK
jgi:hypothetical protein